MEPYIVEALNVVLSDREMNWETVLKEPTLEYEVSGKSKGRITIPVPTKYAYFYVDAAADEYVVLGISCDSKYKLWINQKFNGISPESNSIMVGMVQKGKNTVFFEFLEPISDLSFSCRVSGASYEIQPYPDRLLHRNLYIEHARLSLNVKSVTWGAISRIQFLLALNNHWNIDAKQKIKIQINSYWQDAILSETQGMFNRICSMPFPYDQERNVYTLKVTYKLLDGTEHTKDFYFYSPNLHIHRDETINAILSFVEASSCTSYTRMAFDYLLSSYRAMPTDDSMAQLLKYFDYACEYGALDSLIFSKFFCHSSLFFSIFNV